MKKITYFITVTIFAVFAILTLKTHPTFAAAVMKITPVANAITIKSGDIQNYQFTMENTGTSAFRFKLYTAPYNVTNEEYDADFSTETTHNQITRWITFQDDSGSFVSNPTFSLQPGEKRTVIYRVSVPDDIAEGGQYCVIFAESLPESEASDGAVSVGLNSISRVSLIILGHGQGETKNISEITDFSLTDMFSSHDIDAMAKVKNSGNTDFLAEYILSIESIFGTQLYSTTDNFVVLPQTERKFKTSWGEAPLFGVFRAKFTVNALEQQREETHIVFILPTFMIIIALLLLTSIIVWTIILLRKRKERSSRLVV